MGAPVSILAAYPGLIQQLRKLFLPESPRYFQNRWVLPRRASRFFTTEGIAVNGLRSKGGDGMTAATSTASTLPCASASPTASVSSVTLSAHSIYRPLYVNIRLH
jgi:hypothetical protein